ncbi:MAG: tRNA epoxyqueuosine(34) reductase QueG [Acidobacteriota bacterium]|nr:tRNA epoxyqueuosine(34) reductase QueG [Acidobacteriota bacterium]
MNERERTEWVSGKAREAGFDLCGVAPASRFPELERMTEWLERGHAGEMRYLHDPRRLSLDRAMEGAKSVIVCAASYRTAEPLSTEVLASPDTARPRGWISRYGWGDDYHDVMLPRLRILLNAMREEFGEEFRAHAYVDTGPVVERVAAKYAGLGWLAKNTCLINQKMGSFLFLGAIVTTLAFEPTLGPAEAPPPDLCGSCRRCIDACPTQAFVEPYVMDPRRCIAYFTIELRTSIPEEFRPAMGQMVFGCDICQDVCPWNQKAARTGESTLGRIPEFRPRVILPPSGADTPVRAPLSPLREESTARNDCASETAEASRSLFAPEIEWIASLDEEEYRRVFRRSPVKRAKYRGLIRNACVALGNSGPGLEPEARERIVKLLERLAASPDELIAEHARWALDRLNGQVAAKGL